MKLVKEHINEKFVEDSDPIQDMGIGMEKSIENFMIEVVKQYNLDKLIIQSKNYQLAYTINAGKTDFADYLLNKGVNINNDACNSLFCNVCKMSGIRQLKYLIEHGYNIHYDDDHGLVIGAAWGNYDIVKILVDAGANIMARKGTALIKAKNGFADPHNNAIKNDYKKIVDLLSQKIRELKRKKLRKFFGLKENLYEKFIEDSDPIKDMGIGVRGLIKKWLDKMEIKKYTINEDNTIDVDGNVILAKKINGNLPKYINFNYVSGHFLCPHNNMTTLRGCPKELGHYFDCSNNDLTSLEYAPKKTTNFYCVNNKRQFSVSDVLNVSDVRITIFTKSYSTYDWPSK